MRTKVLPDPVCCIKVGKWGWRLLRQNLLQTITTLVRTKKFHVSALVTPNSCSIVKKYWKFQIVFQTILMICCAGGVSVSSWRRYYHRNAGLLKLVEKTNRFIFAPENDDEIAYNGFIWGNWSEWMYSSSVTKVHYNYLSGFFCLISAFGLNCHFTVC